jgi:hypothetical protein
MAFTTPTTASGQVLTSAIWNASVRDNLLHLFRPARAHVSHSTTQSIANTTATALVFDTEDSDTFGMHSASGSRLTAPTDWSGWWIVAAACEFAANATGQRSISLAVNGTASFGYVRVGAAASGVTQLQTSAIVRMAAASYVECFVSQTSGGALNVSVPVFHAVWLADA